MQPGTDGQVVTTTTPPAKSNEAEVPIISTSSTNNDNAEELSEMVQKKLTVEGNNESDTVVEGGDSK